MSKYILAFVLNIKAWNIAITYRKWTRKKTYASSLLKWTPDRKLLAWLHFLLYTWSLQRSTSLYLDMEQFSNCQSHRRNHKQRCKKKCTPFRPPFEGPFSPSSHSVCCKIRAFISVCVWAAKHCGSSPHAPTDVNKVCMGIGWLQWVFFCCNCTNKIQLEWQYYWCKSQISNWQAALLWRRAPRKANTILPINCWYHY